MDNYFGVLVEGFIVYILIFCINYFFNKPKEEKEVQLELYYLSSVYKVNINKINKKRFKIISSLINSLIITIIYLILVYLIKSILLKIFIGILLLILLIIVFYGILGSYYLWREGKNVQS